MIPVSANLTQQLQNANTPTRTYKIHTEVKRISGWTTDTHAMEQMIYLTLNTERYKFVIYSWDYGVELVDLFGQSKLYVEAELPYRIRDALLIDNRVISVDDFSFTFNKNKVITNFTVKTTEGDFIAESEVTI